jgi:aminopeptidase
VVENLVLELRAGKVVSFEASAGEEVFAQWLEVDEGARYLGELGLVGEDSPVADSQKVFHHLLLDENAAAHVALGQGFATCFDFGGESSPGQLDAAGCNRSAIHTDIPFGSPEVTVVATQTRQGEVVLLERGAWTVA